MKRSSSSLLTATQFKKNPQTQQKKSIAFFSPLTKTLKKKEMS